MSEGKSGQGLSRLLAILGPGMLFAASAVGVSHLVQSTRAGANYGLTLTILLLGACLIKYPAFRFGSDYAAITGKSLLDGYQRQGRFKLLIFALTAKAKSQFDTKTTNPLRSRMS